MAVYPFRSFSWHDFGHRFVGIDRYPGGQWVATTHVYRPVAEGSSLDELRQKVDAWHEVTYGPIAQTKISEKEMERYYSNLEAKGHAIVKFKEPSPGHYVAISHESLVIADGESHEEVYREVEEWGRQFLELSEEENARWLPERGEYRDWYFYVEPIKTKSTKPVRGWRGVVDRWFGEYFERLPVEK